MKKPTGAETQTETEVVKSAKKKGMKLPDGRTIKDYLIKFADYLFLFLVWFAVWYVVFELCKRFGWDNIQLGMVIFSVGVGLLILYWIRKVSRKRKKKKEEDNAESENQIQS